MSDRLGQVKLLQASDGFALFPLLPAPCSLLPAISLQQGTFDLVIPELAESYYLNENLGIGGFNLQQPGLEFYFAQISLTPDTFTIAL